MIDNLIDSILEHANACLPQESCGVIVTTSGRNKYIPCKNKAFGNNDFIIDPIDYAKAEDIGEISYIVHSHPYSLPEPSQTDLYSIELSGIPWVIINPGSQKYTVNYPKGYKPPLIGREFKHGLVDCYTLIRDYYKEHLGLDMYNYPRSDQWWLKTNENLYIDNYEREGFVKITDGSIKEHDFLLMRIASQTENHGAVYVGNNMILHHPMNRLSSRDVYGGWWRKVTTATLRYKDLV